MNDIPKELIKQYQKEMQDDIESMAQHQEFCTRIFVLIEKHFNQSRLMTKSDIYILLLILIWFVQTIITYDIVDKKNKEISNYKSWAESTQEELNRFRYENKI